MEYCNRKKLRNLFHLNCGPQIRQIWIHLTTTCETIARQGVQNTHHLNELKQRLRTQWTKLDCGSYSSVASLMNWRVCDHMRVASLRDQQAGEVPWEADCRDRVMRDGKSGCWPSERKRKVDERGLRHKSTISDQLLRAHSPVQP